MLRKIEIVPYDPQWPHAFEMEAQKLKVVFGSELVAVHHAGSTSIPGIKAKPVIDSLVIIKDASRVHEFDEGMIHLGYRPRGECLDTPSGTPGRFYYSKDTAGKRTHQAHIMKEGHIEIEEMLSFRDYLRAHDEEAQAYSRLKERLAQENTSGIVEYIAGKSGFIQDTAQKAERWRREMSVGYSRRT